MIKKSMHINFFEMETNDFLNFWLTKKTKKTLINIPNRYGIDICWLTNEWIDGYIQL